MPVVFNYDKSVESTKESLNVQQQKNNTSYPLSTDVKTIMETRKKPETANSILVFGAGIISLAAGGIAILFPLAASIIVPIATIGGAVALSTITRKLIKSLQYSYK
ncbi:hypothetical protein EP47_02725 [Legionella norrlandica]|uniref:Uncharacterized protein n=1 Tax=Legionella norrlandica TaxID=1498499 RepID=A0A0A2SPE2_9GAMM|nr:hypothetical protein [Legionella norrlandica]KGP62985.1 hypothetical protein EP47_02725 [Legionella norrlandica]